MRSIILRVSLSVAALACHGEAPAAIPVNFGWGTDNVMGGAGDALYSDAGYTQRLVGLGMGAGVSFATNDYVQLIADVDGDGFAPPDFTQPDFVGPSDELVAAAFIGLGQNHPALNPSQHTGQFWAGGMTQYGAQYNSDAPWVGKPIMVRFWDTPRDQILASHNDPDREPSWGEYSGGMTLPASSTDWAFMEIAQVDLYTDKQAPPSGPVLSLSATSFSFSADEGGENPPSQTLQVWNSGGGALDWLIEEEIGWLSVSPASGSSAGEKDDVGVSVDITGLSVGTYNGDITLSATGAQGSPKTVPVTLEITPGPSPELSCSPSSFSFSAIEGGSNPAPQTLQVWNSGAGSLDWLLGKDIGWLSVSPESGTSSGEKDEVQVSVEIASLPAGTHHGTLTVSADESQGSPKSVQVTLEIIPSPAPELSCSPSSFSFFATVGGNNPPPQTLQVWNSGTESLDWSIHEDIAWLSAAPDSGSSSGEKDDVALSVDISSLAAGNYTGEITVSATDAQGSPMSVPVTLEITSAEKPELSVAPVTLSFWGVEGASDPPSQTLQIRNTGGGTLSWTVEEDISWLAASPGSGISTGEVDNVTVSIDLTSLSAGTYNGTITILAPEALGSPASVGVSLQIYAAGQLVYFGWGTDEVIEGEGFALYSDAALTERLEGIGVGGSFDINDYVQLIVDLDGDGFASPDFTRADLVHPSDKLLSEAFIGLAQNSPAANPDENTGQFWAGGMTQYGAQYNSTEPWVGKPILVRFWDTPKSDIPAAYQAPGNPPRWGEFGGGMLLPAITTDWSFTDAADSDLYTNREPSPMPPPGQQVYFGWGTDEVIEGEGFALYSDAALTERLEGIGVGGSFDINDYVQLIVDLDGDGFASPDFTRADLVHPSDKLLSEAFIGLAQNSPAANPDENTGQFWAGGMTQYGAQYNSNDAWVGKPIMVRFWDTPKSGIRASYQSPTSEPHWGEYGGGMLLPDTTADWSFINAAGDDLYTDQAPLVPPPPGELVYFGWGTDEVIEGEGFALYSDAALTQRLEGIGVGGSFDINDYVQLIVDLDGDGFASPDFTRADLVHPSDKLLSEAFIGLAQNSPAANPDEHTGQFWAGGMTQYGAQYNSNDAWVGKPIMVRFWNTPRGEILALYQGSEPGLLWGEYSGGMTLPSISTDWSFTERAKSDLYTSMGINQAPVLSQIGDKQIAENELLTFIVSATDPDGTTPTLVASNLPGGATFVDNGDGTGTFNWTPTHEQVRVYPGVHFEASDGLFIDSEDITITVKEVIVNRAPVLSPIGDKVVDENQLLSFTVSATDPDGTTPTLVASNLPGGATFVDNGDGTGIFNWTPTHEQVRVYPGVHFEASDGVLTDSEDITITVNDVNRAPVLSPIGDKVVDENHLLSFEVTATDPDGTTPTLTASNLPEGATFVDNGNGTGAFNWTPTYEQAAVYASVHFEASDGVLTDSEDITITVNDVNRAPVLSPIGDKVVDENQLLSFTVSATDPDGRTPSLAGTNLPPAAGFTDNGDGTGTFTWTPTSDQVGVYPGVHFEASDGELIDTEVIDIMVIKANRPPILSVIGGKQVAVNHTLILGVSATDPEGTIPTLAASYLPEGATFTDNHDGTGTFLWMPRADQIGGYIVLFWASDGLSTDSEYVLITVVSGRRAAILEVTITPSGKVRIRWEPFGTGQYKVQCCFDLACGVWENIAGVSWPVTGTTWECDLGDVPWCFYRVVDQ